MTMSLRIGRPRSCLDIGASPVAAPLIAVAAWIVSTRSDVTYPRLLCVAWDVISTSKTASLGSTVGLLANGRWRSSVTPATDRC
jgi:hypothetical protein